MAISHGYIVCLAAILIFSTHYGIIYGFSQFLIPIGREFNSSMAVLGRLKLLLDPNI